MLALFVYMNKNCERRKQKMKSTLFIGVLVCVLCLTGCSENALRYEKMRSANGETVKNWVVESYEGVTAEVKEAVPDHLTVELYNDLKQEIIFWGWNGVYTERDDGWYMVRPPKEVVSPSVDTISEKKWQLPNNIQPGSSQEFTLDFTEVYQGLTLPTGNYRIAISFDLSEPDNNDDRREIEKTWLDFTIS